MPRKTIPIEPITYLSILDEAGQVDRKLLPEIPPEKLLAMYRTMVRSRRLEESMLRRQRQGQMGTFAPAMGQEACQVGAMAALEATDWLVPSFRELPAALWRGAAMRNVFLYTMGFEEGSVVPEGARVLPISIPVGSQACHAAVWMRRGVEIAHWLFWQKKIVGSFMTPAKFIASWTAPSDVAPSPKNPIATARSPRRRIAHARPAAWHAWLPTGIEIGSTRAPSGTTLPSSKPIV